MKIKKLPNKPSKLIRAALEDLAACEADPRYKVTMKACWHTPVDGKCKVCLAGAVMAKRLYAPSDRDITTLNYAYDPHTRKRLLALDDFRSGNIRAGLNHCLIPVEFKFPDRLPIPDYNKKRPHIFHTAMSALADLLEVNGL
jgi:hypothetical protein